MTTKTNVYQELARLEGERDAAIAARAAEAAQHRQEKDTLRTMATRLTCWRCGTAAFQPNERCDSHLSWMDRLQTEVEHHNAWRKRADEAEARLAAVEAERDLHARHIDRAWAMLANCYDIESRDECERSPLTHDGFLPLEMAIHAVYKRDPKVSAVAAERDRLKAALSTAAFALDLAGFRRDRDAAYAALTPQGQSTDGETR